MNRMKSIFFVQCYTLFELSDFLRDKRSSDLNQPSFCGVSVSNDVLELFELFCDGVRFGIGLAFGVDKRLLVAMSESFKHKTRQKLNFHSCIRSKNKFYGVYKRTDKTIFFGTRIMNLNHSETTPTTCRK